MENNILVNQDAEIVHGYMENGWGEKGWELLTFLPELETESADKSSTPSR